MATTLTLRSIKGAPLSFSEGDANMTALAATADAAAAAATAAQQTASAAAAAAAAKAALQVGALSADPNVAPNATAVVNAIAAAILALGNAPAPSPAPAPVVAPTITSQPAAQSITAPNTATFTVAATTGGGTLAYQWQRSNDSGSTWANVSTGTGATSANYTTAATTTADSLARFRVLVSNSANASSPLASSSATLTVSAATVPLSISGTPATSATVGTVYSATFAASGGAGGNVFSLASGTLPAGLTLNSSTGAISGTPTAAGTASGLSVRVTDLASATATSATFGITVAAAVADTRPGWVAAASSGAVAALIPGRTILTNGTNGGNTGVASLTTTGSNYAFFVVANPTAPTFTDVGGGVGGFSAAGTAVVAGTTWYLYQSSFPGTYTNRQVTLS